MTSLENKIKTRTVEQPHHITLYAGKAAISKSETHFCCITERISLLLSPLSVCTKVTAPGQCLRISRHICECSQQLHHRGLGRDLTRRQGRLSMLPVPDELYSPANTTNQNMTV